MNWNDIQPGITVYHSLMTHWGKGIVIKVDAVGFLEAMFERGRKRVVVQFEGHDNSSRMRLNKLRKTPNRRKIKEMVDFYQRRGTNAVDGGDRLLLPPKPEKGEG